MSKQFNTYRVGIESMTEQQLGWWEKKGVTYKPILEYNPLSKEETSRLKTEYYDNNNRVGFEKLYAAVSSKKPHTQKKSVAHSAMSRSASFEYSAVCRYRPRHAYW